MAEDQEQPDDEAPSRAEFDQVCFALTVLTGALSEALVLVGRHDPAKLDQFAINAVRKVKNAEFSGVPMAAETNHVELAVAAIEGAVLLARSSIRPPE